MFRIRAERRTSRRQRLGLAIGLVSAAMLLGLVQPVAGAAPAAAGSTPAAPKPRQVKGREVSPGGRTPIDEAIRAAEAKPRPAAWPKTAAGRVSLQRGTGRLVSLPGKAAVVGSLPVRAATAAKGAEVPGDVAVDVLGQDAAARLGLVGVVMQVTPSTPGEPVDLDVDYSSFAQAIGGDWATRLQLVSLPACALTDPERAQCRTSSPLPNANHVKAGRIVGTVPAGRLTVSSATGVSASATVVALAAAGGTGGAGDYKATSLSPSATWKVAGQTGSFSWTYPLKAPPVTGPAPNLAISYDSGSVDGRTSSTNNQSSWVGEGFSMESGFVERSYVPCQDDMTGGNNTVKTGDQCWKTDNASLVLGGHSSELVKDTATGVWKLKNDDGSKIERLHGATNGDNDQEYWVLTTTDGTKYYFGIGKRYPADTADTHSTWTLPVAGNQSGEPCNKSTFAASFCPQAWRWNLDYVVDVDHNTMTYFYKNETNRYRRDASATAVGYDRGGYLTRIDYGTRYGTEAGLSFPPARVVFETAERCLPTSTFDCAESKLTAAKATSWPDVPFDQICADTTADCGASRSGPTFFSRKRLSRVIAQYLDGTKAQTADVWTLGHKFPSNGDGTAPGLWLDTLGHSGRVGASAEAANVKFGGIQLRNRVEDLDGAAPLIKFRVNQIDSESGGRVNVTYQASDCTASTLPKPESNTKRCYPGFWLAPGASQPSMTWFNKYPAKEVVDSDLTGGSLAKVSDYDYLGAPAWHYDDSELTKPKWRTYSDWRGYQKVRVRAGGANVTNTDVIRTYLRGMDGDPLPDGGKRSVTVTDSQGTAVRDVDRVNGFELEEVTYNGWDNGVDGAEVSGTTYQPWVGPVTAADGTDSATVLAPQAVRGRTDKADGSQINTQVISTFDPDTGLPLTVSDYGDTAVASDDRCTSNTYLKNTTANIVATVSETQTVSAACSVTPTLPAQLVSDVRSYYDGSDSLTAAPSRGLITKTEHVSGWSGDDPVWTVVSQTGYDVLGRVTSIKDALGRKTSTAYTPATSLPLAKTTTTNNLNQVSSLTVHPAWGLPLVQTDANGRRTEMTYDMFGRVKNVWGPDRSSATQTPSAKFGYVVSTSTMSAVSSQRLLQDGTYALSYTLYDGLLRLRQVQSPAYSNDGGRLVNETVYDTRGLATEANGPYWATGVPSTTRFQPTVEIPNRNVTDYDGASRPVKSTLLVGGTEKWHTTTSYDGNVVNVDPPAGAVPTTSIVDARGRLVEQRQYKGTSPSGDYDKTLYTYAPSGQQASVAGPMPAASPASTGPTRTTSYDLLGRPVSIDDPDQGVSTSTYDLAGQVTSSTDSRGQTLASVYDGLGRKTETHQDSATGPLLAKWTYDSLLLGQLTSSTTYAGDSTFVKAVTGYDAGYRPTGTSLAVSGVDPALDKTYSKTTEYDSVGNVHNVSYPAVADLRIETVGYDYDKLGLPKNLLGLGTGTYVTGTQRSSYGEPMQYAFGSVTKMAWQTFGYEEGTHRLNRSWVQRENQTAADADVAYSYDPAGNVTKVADTGVQPETQCFQYDDLARLSQAWTATNDCAGSPDLGVLGGPAPYWQTFNYDVAGRRTSDVSHDGAGDTTRTYTYGNTDGTQPDTLQKVAQTGPAGASTATYGYDPTGNTTTRNVDGTPQTLDWDINGDLASVTHGSDVTSFVNDGDGGRLLKNDPDATTLYWDDIELRLDKTTGAVTGTHYYSFDGRMVAIRTGTAVTMVIDDHQSTAALQMDRTSQALTRQRQLPFGGDRGTQPAPWAGTKGFVGGTKDTSIGLTSLGAREYDPDTGRFISVDPLFDGKDPASWNGYTYADNNPVTNSDPTGTLCKNASIPEDGGRCFGSGPASDGDPTTQPNASDAGAGGKSMLGSGTSSSGGGHKGGGGGGGHGGGGPSTGGNGGGGGGVVRSFFRGSGDFFSDTWDGLSYAATHPVSFVVASDKHLIFDCYGNFVGCMSQDMMNPVVDRIAHGKYSEALGYGGSSLLVTVVGTKGAGLALRGLSTGAEVAEASAQAAARTAESAPAEASNIRPVAAKPQEAAAAFCKNSFAPGTLVLAADGHRVPISQLKPGMKVVATDPSTGKTSTRTILAVHINHDRDLYDLTVKTADGTETLHTTAGHPMWVDSLHAWVPAESLTVGTRLHTADGSKATVLVGLAASGEADMWNLTIHADHTYYVLAGETAVLVHNTNCGILPESKAIADHANKRFMDPAGFEHYVRGVDPKALDAYVDGVLEGSIPNVTTRYLNRGRVAHWDFNKSAVVIEDGAGGTVFTPRDGRTYFDELK